MDTLTSMILAASLQLGLPCFETSVTPAQFQSMAASVRSHALMPESDEVAGAMRPAVTAASDTYADSEDLLFYFASHAQVVGDFSQAPSTPWLELRSLADLGLRPFSERSQEGAAPAWVGHKACVLSAAGNVAFAETRPAFAPGDAVPGTPDATGNR